MQSSWRAKVRQVIAVRGGLQGAQAGGEGGKHQLSTPGKQHSGLGMEMQDPGPSSSVGCPSYRGVALQHFILALHLSAIVASSVTTDSLTEDLSVHDPAGRRLLKLLVFAFDYCGYSWDPLNASHLANLLRGQRETVWSAAGQTGGDIWGRGTLVPVRPHTNPMRDHRSKRHGEQESD